MPLPKRHAKPVGKSASESQTANTLTSEPLHSSNKLDQKFETARNGASDESLQHSLVPGVELYLYKVLVKQLPLQNLGPALA
jgi:hypothetical protein